MWVTAFVNIVLYIPLALVIKGVVTVNGYKMRITRKMDKIDVRSGSVTQASKGIDAIAMQMLFYPLIYTVTVLPIAIVRFRAFHAQHVPFAATVFADVLFSLSGLFNVILFAFTRPSLLPRRESQLLPHSMSFSLRSRPTDDLQSFSGGRFPTISFSPRSRMNALHDESRDDNEWNHTDIQVEEIEKEDHLTPSFSSIHSAQS